ncbi:SDR family NAD(P)-dependent oxidoreductase [Verrucomicrobiota bacterium]
MTLNLKGKTVLVTGAGRGIGKTISLMLAKAGANVVVAARTFDEIEQTADEIRSGDGEAMAVSADIAKEEDVVTLFSEIHKKYGGLDVLISNAGIGVYGPLADFSVSDFDKIVDVNLRGTFLCCREAMRLMIPRKKGYIINVSSVVGFKGYPNQSVYTAAKHGIMGLTKSLAVEAQEHGIRVSAVLPGGVDTQMVRESRPDLDPEELLQPEDIAQTIAYLLSLSDHAAVDQVYVRRRNSSPF